MQELLGAKFVTIIEKYEVGTTRYLADSEKAVTSGKANKAANIAHPLKSSSASLGFATMAQLANKIENEAQALHQSRTNSLEQLAPRIASLKSTFEALQSALIEKRIH